MTAEREKKINEWLDVHCPKCANNDDRGTEFLNCQAECEVQKDIGIACIHYEEAHDIEPQYEAKVITHGNCMMCGKELTEGLFLCKECKAKAVQGK